MIEKTTTTSWVRIYMSGPIEVAKQIIRVECLRKGLCVTIEPTVFIYTGGEEAGFVVGLLDYPRFPIGFEELLSRARYLATLLLNGTYQHSVLLQTPSFTEWISVRPENQ